MDVLSPKIALHSTAIIFTVKLFKTAVAFFKIMLEFAVLTSLVPILPRFNHIQ